MKCWIFIVSIGEHPHLPWLREDSTRTCQVCGCLFVPFIFHKTAKDAVVILRANHMTSEAEILNIWDCGQIDSTDKQMAWAWNKKDNDIIKKVKQYKWSRLNIIYTSQPASSHIKMRYNKENKKAAQRTYSTLKTFSLTLKENRQDLFGSALNSSAHSRHGMLEKPSVSWSLKPSTSKDFGDKRLQNSGGQQQ